MFNKVKGVLGYILMLKFCILFLIALRYDYLLTMKMHDVKKTLDNESYLNANLSSSNSNRQRYIIFECKYMCGGWDDQLKGYLLKIFKKVSQKSF